MKTIAGQEPRVEYKENRIIIHLGRTTVVWSEGKWVDDNKGKSYMNWQAREQLVNVLNLVGSREK